MNKKNIAEEVQKKINTGEVQMRSHLSVWAEGLGLGSSVVLFILLLITAAGFVIAWLQTNGDLFGETLLGPQVVLQTFPFIFIVAFALLFIGMSFLLRRFDFVYKRSFIGILSIVFGIVLALSWAVSTIPQTGMIRRRFVHVPMMMESRNVIFGTVLVIQSQDDLRSDFTLHPMEGDNVRVLWTRPSLQPATHPFPQQGDYVRVIGDRDGNTMKAVGVKVIEGDPQLFTIPVSPPSE